MILGSAEARVAEKRGGDADVLGIWQGRRGGMSEGVQVFGNAEGHLCV